MGHLSFAAFKNALEAPWPSMKDRGEITRRAYRKYRWFTLAGLGGAKFDSEFINGYQKMRQQLSEIMVADALHRAGFHLARSPKRGGPDFVATQDGTKVQIEVVTPEPVAAVKEYQDRNRNGVFSVPFSSFMECWTKGITTKCIQALGDPEVPGSGWVAKGLLDPAVPFVIVVNGCLFQGDFADEGFAQFGWPMAARAVYAMSEYTMFVNVHSGRSDESGYTHRDALDRGQRSSIPLNTFLDPAFAPVSAVWALVADDYDLRFHPPAIEHRQEVCSSLIHNPNARHPLPLGLLPAGQELTCRVEPDSRTIHRTKGTHVE